MPSIMPCDHAFMSSKRMLVSPVIDFRHSAENGSAKACTKSTDGSTSSAAMMRSACAWNCAVQCDLTVFGETAGKIALRSFMCASPSLRIMLWPISLFISPCGWCDENTSICFSETKMSSRLQSSVLPSCGTKTIGASFRKRASMG